MTNPVSSTLSDGIATITMDDGKVNALTFAMFEGLHAAFDAAERDAKAVVLAGREGKFSAGFDLKTLTGSPQSPDLLRAGFETAHRVLGFPKPVVAACTGHTFAMGLFLMVCADYRIGVSDGATHKITANEVAIGMTMPRTPLVICRSQIAPAYYDRTMVLAEVYNPVTAVDAGILHELVPEPALLEAATAKAAALAELNDRAFAATKQRAHAATLAAMQQAIEEDDAEVRSVLPS